MRAAQPKDYCNFLNIARGSAAELLYLIDLSSELEFLDGPAFEELNDHCERVVKQLQKLIQTMEGLLLKEQKE
jgi:four helix bundle protein